MPLETTVLLALIALYAFGTFVLASVRVRAVDPVPRGAPDAAEQLRAVREDPRGLDDGLVRPRSPSGRFTRTREPARAPADPAARRY